MHDKLRSMTRWRAGLALAALVLPTALLVLFERQASRLESLAEHGQPAEAVVTHTTHRGGTTHYAYEVGGVEHTWSVAREHAPHERGTRFPIVVLPEDPSFSRPATVDPRAEVERSAGLRWGGVLGIGFFFGFFALFVDRGIARMRRGVDESTPEALRERLAMVLPFLTVAIAAISAFHLRQAVSEGEAWWPVVVAGALCLAIVGATLRYVLAEGAAGARGRTAALLRWLAPVALGAALLRLVAWLV